MQDVVYAMWGCGKHRAHMDELADQAHTVVAGRLDELSGAELAKLSCGLVEAEVREVRDPGSAFCPGFWELCLQNGPGNSILVGSVCT